jgi:hypothetical protein
MAGGPVRPSPEKKLLISELETWLLRIYPKDYFRVGTNQVRMESPLLYEGDDVGRKRGGNLYLQPTRKEEDDLLAANQGDY